MVKVFDNGEESEPFPVMNGVKPSCVLAPKLFSMVFSAMLPEAFQEQEEESIPVRYRTNGELFKLSRLKAVKKKVHKTVARDPLFADDCPLSAKTEVTPTPGKSLLKGM